MHAILPHIVGTGDKVVNVSDRACYQIAEKFTPCLFEYLWCRFKCTIHLHICEMMSGGVRQRLSCTFICYDGGAWALYFTCISFMSERKFHEECKICLLDLPRGL